VRQLPHSTALVILAVLGPAIVGAQPAPEFQFRFTQKPGPYAVGLKVVEQYDRSRVFQNYDGQPNAPVTTERPRPLQTLVWYPAEVSTAPKMTIGDYAALIRTETSFDKPVDQGKPQSFVADFTRGTTALPASAVRNSAMLSGRFPVLIYAPSLNAPAIENIELCEYIASQGYVVMATPSMGANQRSMTLDLPGANAEAQDISFLIDFAKSLPDAEISSVAVIGYSWGGMAALFAAARDKRIDALVSLDGSFRYSPGTVQEAGDVHPDQMLIPLLVFSRAEETIEAWDAMHQSKNQGGLAPNVLNEWTRGDLFHIRLLAVSHIQFSSLYQRSERFRKEALQFSPADYSLEEGAESYNWMARYTLEFLDAYLKHDPEAIGFLKRTPAENGVPKHLVAASFRAGSDKPVQNGVPTAK
jgi:pimeloyl-ACP methyl ester carboxylesterase